MKLSLPLASAAASLALAAACIHVPLTGSGSGSFDHRAERVETRPLALEPGRLLVLGTPSGDIRVTASTDERCEVEARVRAWGRTQEEADAVLARYSLEVVSDAEGATVRLVGEPLRLAERSMQLQISADVEYVASVPPGTRVEATTSAGNLEARGPLAACHLTTRHGNVDVQEVRGDLTARSESGNVTARRVEGDELELSTAHGNVRLDRASAERVRCESNSGNVELEDVRAREVELATNHGNVDVTRFAGSLRARSGSGDLSLVEVTGAVEASSNHGAVTLWAPADFACELDARTRHGALVCDFPMLTVAGQPASSSILAGKIGAGGPRVQLSTGSGNVAIRKR